MKSLKSLRAGAVYAYAGLSMLAASPAHASEGATAGGPVGGTDIRNAYLPAKPGLYVTGVFFLSSVDGAFGDGGRKIADSHASLKNFAVGLTYVYPFKIAGGTIASSVQDVYVTGPISLGTRSHFESGFGDIYSDIFSWSKYLGPISGEGASAAKPSLPYGLTVKAAYSMIFPVGHYNDKEVYTAGHHDFYYIPNAAVSYLTGPNALGEGVELSAHAFFDIASYNHRTNYHSGTIADLDFAVSERHGHGQFGLAGFFADQIDDDRVNGAVVLPNGKHNEQFYLGPVAALDVPDLHGTFKAKIIVPVILHNGLAATRYFVFFSTKI